MYLVDCTLETGKAKIELVVTQIKNKIMAVNFNIFGVKIFLYSNYCRE